MGKMVESLAELLSVDNGFPTVLALKHTPCKLPEELRSPLKKKYISYNSSTPLKISWTRRRVPTQIVQTWSIDPTWSNHIWIQPHHQSHPCCRPAKYVQNPETLLHGKLKTPQNFFGLALPFTLGETAWMVEDIFGVTPCKVVPQFVSSLGWFITSKTYIYIYIYRICINYIYKYIFSIHSLYINIYIYVCMYIYI